MKKLLAVLLAAIMLAVLPLAAQAQKKYRVVQAPVATKDTVKNWYLVLQFSKINDANFKSDAITGEVGWYLFNGIDASWPDVWNDATLSIGPFMSLSWNSGILNNQDYAENLRMWNGGVSTMLSFKQSFMTFNALVGTLVRRYTYASGYVDNPPMDWVFAGKLAYESSAGRAKGESFVPAWKMSLAGSYPQSPQRTIDWGYQELTHRLGDYGTNTYSVHATADLDIFDFGLSTDIIMPLTLRGIGGKYNTSINYLGLGAGTAFIYDKQTAATISFDKVWGWENNKFDNWAINFALHLSFFQQLW